MPKENTKDMIIGKCLELFAEKGYSAVSMRDIAEAVGIRSSTIYYYFKSKQDVFNAMIEKAEIAIEEQKTIFMQTLNRVSEIKREEFVRVAVQYVTAYLKNKKMDQLLRTLESERFHDTSADMVWRRILFDAPALHEQKVFENLLDRDLVRGDAKKLADEYHSIIMLGYFSEDTDRLADMLGDFYDRAFCGKSDD
ncbi:MAG: TetR/AcrR family transcriptional regulator [Oscillospiraceae bacterium]|nr:TetR/AcrR family transcriptional regulator [Oscillospiraceae bacterium]